MRNITKEVEVIERESKSKTKPMFYKVLPSDMFYYLFGFLRPVELALIATVSIYFLRQANSSVSKYVLSKEDSKYFLSQVNPSVFKYFSRQANSSVSKYALRQKESKYIDTTMTELSADFSLLRSLAFTASINKQNRDGNLTDLNRALLIPKYLIAPRRGLAKFALDALFGDTEKSFEATFEKSMQTPNYRRRTFFHFVRTIIFSGRLSLQEAINGISALSDLSALLLTHESVLAQEWVKSMAPWVHQAVADGFTFADLYSTWFTNTHADARSGKRIPLHALRGAENKQVFELITRADQFQNIIFNAASAGQTEIITARLEGLDNEQRYAFVSALQSMGPNTDESPLFVAVLNGYPTAVTALLTGLEPDQIALIVARQHQGECNSVNILFLAASEGRPLILTALLTALTKKQIEILMVAPQGEGPVKGMSALFIAVCRRCVPIVEMLLAGFQSKQIASFLVAPQDAGPAKGESALFIAAFNGDALMMKALLARFKSNEILALIAHKQGDGKFRGINILFIAADNGCVSTVVALLESLTISEQALLILAPQGEGRFKGQSSLYVAQKHKHVEIVKLMQSTLEKLTSEENLSIKGALHHLEVKSLLPTSGTTWWEEFSTFPYSPTASEQKKSQLSPDSSSTMTSEYKILLGSPVTTSPIDIVLQAQGSLQKGQTPSSVAGGNDYKEVLTLEKKRSQPDSVSSGTIGNVGLFRLPSVETTAETLSATNPSGPSGGSTGI